MRFSLTLLICLILCMYNAEATQVYFTKNASEADARVYFSSYRENADFTVYFSTNGLLDGECVLFETPREKAEVIFYKVAKSKQADYILFESSYRFDASLECPF